MQWCLPALICYSLVSIYGTVLTATGHIRAFAWINALAVVVNTGLNLWWIPAYGALGCSWAALISQGLCGLLVMIYAHQKLKVAFHLRSILMYIFIGGILFAYFRAGQWAGIGNWFLLTGGGILSILTIWASGLFPVHKWKMMLSQADHDQ
jgi:O-antigen/teichoic acid export membrane protein